MMQTLQGIAVSPGVAIGEALIIDTERFRIPRRFVVRDVVDDELRRLDRAVESVAGHIEQNRDTVSKRLGQQYGAIFTAHLSMLRDPQLIEELHGKVREDHFSPEYAVSCVLRRYAKVFQELDNPYLAERAHDIYDLQRSLLGSLLGRRREELAQLTSPVIVLAHDLTPSETARLNPRFVLGFVTELGGPGGHTAIVAKAQEIPAIVGAGQFLSDVSGGNQIIVDGDQGKVVVEPDEATVDQYIQERERHRSIAVQLQTIHDLPAETLDGVRIHLGANIEFPSEIAACLHRGADGIGLYRTEFLYLAGDTEPTEEDHYAAYSQVIRAMDGRPVVIRTLDLGADKMGQSPRAEEENNPFLGMRSIRLSLRNPPLFRTQLRAVMRASVLGPMRLMFPMISTLDELRRAKEVLADVMDGLEEEGLEFDPKPQIGMMVEVPSAVVLIDRFVREVDFVSIGTNDLVQYTLAVDRSNKEVADLYQSGDPAVLRLIDQTARAARAAGIPVSACGQMSGLPRYAMLLMGLGVHSLSVPPSALLEIKKLCRSVSLAHCESIAARVLAMDTAREVDSFLTDELRKLVPDLVIH